VPKNLSFSDVARLQQIFREVLGRDLTPEEQRYLGLSVTAIPMADLELKNDAEEKHRLKKAKAS
jgi:hypothetical protein